MEWDSESRKLSSLSYRFCIDVWGYIQSTNFHGFVLIQVHLESYPEGFLEDSLRQLVAYNLYLG